MWNDTDIPERWVVHLLCGVSSYSKLFPKVYKFLMQLCKSFFYNFKSYGSYLLRLEPFTLAQLFFWSPLLLRLPATLGFTLKMTICNVVSSIFSDLTP